MIDMFLHYQWVQTGYGKNIQYTCHEAYSTKYGLYAVNPIPVLGYPDVEEEAERDLEKFGIVEFADIIPKIDKYEEQFEIPTLSKWINVDYSDDEEQDIDDGYDEKGNVIDLVEYMRRNI